MAHLEIMAFINFTADKAVRRLRWIALFVMLLDAACTLIGQPASFWRDPSTTNEGSPIVRFFLARGLLPFAVCGILYVVGVLIIASVTPRRIGLAVLFYLILGHFFGMSTWLRYYFHCNHGILDALQVAFAVLITLAVCQEKV